METPLRPSCRNAPHVNNRRTRARCLSPSLGHLLSADSVQPNARGTQGYDPYSYVADDPTSLGRPQRPLQRRMMRRLLLMSWRIRSGSARLILGLIRSRCPNPNSGTGLAPGEAINAISKTITFVFVACALTMAIRSQATVASRQPAKSQGKWDT